MTEAQARGAVVEAVHRLDALGMNRGSTGNASHRCALGGRAGMLITPTGMGAELGADDVVHVADDGTLYVTNNADSLEGELREYRPVVPSPLPWLGAN